MQNNNVPVVGFVVGAAAYVGFLAAIIFLAVRWSRTILQRKADALGAPLVTAGARLVATAPRGGLYTGRESEYELAGRRVFINAYYVSRSFVRVHLRMPSAPMPWVTLYPEGAFQRLGKTLGINREVQLGDAAFDDAVYVDAAEKNDDHVRALLTPPAVRAALGELLSLGYKVEFSPTGVAAFQVVYASVKIDGSTAARVAAALQRIVDAAPRFDAAALTASKGFFARGPIAMVLAGIGAGLALLVVGGVLSGRGEPIDTSAAGPVLAAGGAVWVAYVVGLLLIVRGTSSAFAKLLVGAFLGLFTLPAGTAVVLTGLNRTLDASPAEVHAVAVRRMSGRNHNLYVESWRPDHAEERLSTTHEFFDSVHVGDRVEVRSHPGRFGWPWAEAVTTVVR